MESLYLCKHETGRSKYPVMPRWIQVEVSIQWCPGGYR